MEQHHALFLQILSAALREQTPSLPDSLAEEDWEAILALAREHDVLPLVFEVLYPLPGLKSLPCMAAARSQVMQKVTIQAIKTDAFLNLNRHLRAAGVRAVVVKGLVCRELYPQPDNRPSNDEDVLVAPEQYGLCHEVLTNFGMVPSVRDLDRDSAYEVPYSKPGSPLFIELHKHLFPPESEAYGDLNRFFDGVFDRAAEDTFQGQAILTMAPSDHFFYLICHSFKHFLHSGFGIRQVCDICLFAQKYASAIDWPQVWENCRAIRADVFTAAIFAIGQKHLHIDLAAVSFPEVDETALLQDLLQGGTFGDADANRKQSASMTLTAVSNQKQGKQEAGLLNSLFPSAKTLEGRYRYLQRKPWLPLLRNTAYRRIEAMYPNINRRAAEILMEELVSLLEEAEQVPLVISGSSMAPFLVHGRDSVLLSKVTRPLKKGDIILYRRDNGAYVVHRICRLERGGSYCLIGDAQTEKESGIRPDQVKALVTSVIRKGQKIGPDSFWWRFFETAWLCLIPLRPLLTKLAALGRK